MRKKQDIMWEQSTLITKQIQAIKMEFPKLEFHSILFFSIVLSSPLERLNDIN